MLAIVRLEVTTSYCSLSMVMEDDCIELMLPVADDHTMVGGGIPLATHVRVVSDPKSMSIGVSSLGSVMLAGAVIHRKQNVNIVKRLISKTLPVTVTVIESSLLPAGLEAVNLYSPLSTGITEALCREVITGACSDDEGIMKVTLSNPLVRASSLNDHMTFVSGRL